MRKTSVRRIMWETRLRSYADNFVRGFFFGAGFMLVAGICLLLALTGRAHAMDADDANAACRVAIKAKLLNPNTATFGPRFAHGAGDTWTVAREVTAQTRLAGRRTVTLVCQIRGGRVVKVVQ